MILIHMEHGMHQSHPLIAETSLSPNVGLKGGVVSVRDRRVSLGIVLVIFPRQSDSSEGFSFLVLPAWHFP